MVRCKGTVQQHQKNIYSRPMWDCLSERCSPHKLRQAAQRFMYYSDLFSNSVFLVLHEKDLTGWFVKCTSGWRQRLPKTFLWEPSGVASSQAICTHLYMGWTCVTSDWPLPSQVLCNVDELFERDELSAAPDPGWPDCFNSGVFVFRPSLQTHARLLDHALQHGSFDGETWLHVWVETN